MTTTSTTTTAAAAAAAAAADASTPLLNAAEHGEGDNEASNTGATTPSPQGGTHEEEEEGQSPTPPTAASRVSRFLLLATPPTLTVDDVEAFESSSWGWVFAAGCIHVLIGILALLCPVVSTEIVLVWIASLLMLIGIFNLSGLFYAEHGMKVATCIHGIFQMILSILTLANPLLSLIALTAMIATVFMLEGMFRVLLACRAHPDVPGRVPLLLNGFSNVLCSIIILSSMPLSALITLGVLIGTNLIVSGFARITLGCMMRRRQRNNYHHQRLVTDDDQQHQQQSERDTEGITLPV